MNKKLRLIIFIISIEMCILIILNGVSVFSNININNKIEDFIKKESEALNTRVTSVTNELINEKNDNKVKNSKSNTKNSNTNIISKESVESEKKSRDENGKNINNALRQDDNIMIKVRDKEGNNYYLNKGENKEASKHISYKNEENHLRKEKSINGNYKTSENWERYKRNKEEDIYDKIDEDEVVSVFKVKTSQIKKSLTMSDNIKLIKVAQKLDLKDFKKIKEYLYADNQEQGVLNAIYLLREKLNDKDYQSVREVAQKFINMDMVEKNKNLN